MRLGRFSLVVSRHLLAASMVATVTSPVLSPRQVWNRGHCSQATLWPQAMLNSHRLTSAPTPSDPLYLINLNILTLSLSHTHTHNFTQIYTHTQACTHTHTHKHTHFTHTLTNTHTHAHTQPLSLYHTHMHATTKKQHSHHHHINKFHIYFILTSSLKRVQTDQDDDEVSALASQQPG